MFAGLVGKHATDWAGRPSLASKGEHPRFQFQVRVWRSQFPRHLLNSLELFRDALTFSSYDELSHSISEPATYIWACCPDVYFGSVVRIGIRTNRYLYAQATSTSYNIRLCYITSWPTPCANRAYPKLISIGFMLYYVELYTIWCTIT